MSFWSRRQFARSAGFATALSVLGLRPSASTAGASDLCSLTAAAAVGLMRRGDLTAEAYASALLQRHEATKSLNAFISIEPQKVLEAARAADKMRSRGRATGLLHGLPIPVKDSINSANLPTTCGTAALRYSRPATNAPALQKLLSQGAILLGKTNLHELGLGVTSNNVTFGACRNPYDPSRSPGGSSGGSAVAVSSGVAPLALGEDTTCSIRVPAALCGIVGLRPSADRYPTGGVMPISPRFDCIGPLARVVEDIILFDTVLRPDGSRIAASEPRGVRLGVPSDYWSGLDPEVEQISTGALVKLRDFGVEIVRFDLPSELQADLAYATDILSYEVVANESAYLKQYAPQVGLDQFLAQIGAPLRKRFDDAFIKGSLNSISDDRYRRAVVAVGAMRGAVDNSFATHQLTAMVFPPAMSTALPIGTEDDIIVGGQLTSVRTAMLRNTVHTSCIGMPGLVLPAGLSANRLPIGLEFDMLPGSDAKLLSLGLSLQHALGNIAPPAIGNTMVMPNDPGSPVAPHST